MLYMWFVSLRFGDWCKSRSFFFYDTRKTTVPDGRRASRYIGPLPTCNRVLPRTRPGPPRCDPGHPTTGPTGARPTDPRHAPDGQTPPAETQDRKSTRLNSSHVKISYAVFCLKKKKKSR